MNVQFALNLMAVVVSCRTCLTNIEFILINKWRVLQTDFRENLNLSTCIICQTIKNDHIVENLASHEKVLTCIQQWASYGNLDQFESWSRLRSFTAQELKDKGASWHTQCYKDATHTGMLKRAKDRYERQLTGPNETRRKVSTQAPMPIKEITLRITRSKMMQYTKETCFFVSAVNLATKPYLMYLIHWLYSPC